MGPFQSCMCCFHYQRKFEMFLALGRHLLRSEVLKSSKFSILFEIIYINYQCNSFWYLTLRLDTLLTFSVINNVLCTRYRLCFHFCITSYRSWHTFFENRKIVFWKLKDPPKNSSQLQGWLLLKVTSPAQNLPVIYIYT